MGTYYNESIQVWTLNSIFMGTLERQTLEVLLVQRRWQMSYALNRLEKEKRVNFYHYCPF